MRSSFESLAFLTFVVSAPFVWALPPSPVPAEQNTNIVGIAGRDGITLSDTGALVTRNGVTEKMTAEMKLSSGATVMPNGTIVGTDGSSVTMRQGQLLTFDGKLVATPAATTAAPASGINP